MTSRSYEEGANDFVSTALSTTPYVSADTLKTYSQKTVFVPKLKINWKRTPVYEFFRVTGGGGVIRRFESTTMKPSKSKKRTTRMRDKKNSPIFSLVFSVK
jgi:hypothetical protein